MKLLFLHGFAADGSIWKEYQDLPGEIICPDLSFNNDGSPNLPQMDKPFFLVGWSMGAMVALRMIRAYGSLVQGAVLISSSPGYISSPVFPEGREMQKVEQLILAIEKGDGKAITHFQRELFSIDEIRAGWLKRFRREIAPHIKVTKEDLLNALRYLKKETFENFPQVDLPLYALHGSDDNIVDNRALEAWQKLFPSVKTVLMKCGHALPFVKRESVKSFIKAAINEHC